MKTILIAALFGCLVGCGSADGGATPDQQAPASAMTFLCQGGLAASWQYSFPDGEACLTAPGLQTCEPCELDQAADKAQCPVTAYGYTVTLDPVTLEISDGTSNPKCGQAVTK